MKVLIKFKVGDKVRIKKDLVVGKDYGVINLQHYMKEDLGKESVVTGVYCRVNNRACTYKLSGSAYVWSEEMLEPVEEKEMVNHPQHYNACGSYETIRKMELLFGKENVVIWAKLNAFKYRDRAESKGNDQEDIDKMDWYLKYVEENED